MSEESKSRLLHGDAPWRDESLLYRLYHEEKRSALEISEMWGCSQSTVSEWLDRHEKIEKRSISEAVTLGHGKAHYVPLLQHTDGYEEWKVGNDVIHVHRLLAISEWGPDAVAGMHVHHKNGIPWDNRIENLELLHPSEHQQSHRKVTGEKRRKIADVYENTDRSSRDVAAEFDVSMATVLRLHRENYGDDDE